jgi:hypothetical protein
MLRSETFNKHYIMALGRTDVLDTTITNIPLRLKNPALTPTVAK